MTVLVEGLMYAIGIWIYLRVTRARDKIGHWSLWLFVIVVAVVYMANIFSPPPPSVEAILVVAIPFVWLLIVSAWWADRLREARG